MRTESPAESPCQPSSDDFVDTARRVATPMAIGIALATAATVAVGSLVTSTVGGSLDRFDLDVVEQLVAERAESLDQLTASGERLADTVPVLTLWIAALAIGAWRTAGWTVPVFVLFVVGGDKVSYLLANQIVDRPRPPVDQLGHVFSTSSFPSGHVGSAVTLYGAIVVAFVWHRHETGRRPATLVVAAAAGGVLVVVILVAFSRLYRGQHYPSDVVWAVVLGAAWLHAGYRIVLAPGRSD